VDVILGLVRERVVHHVREPLDVDAPRGNIGRDKETDTALLETGKVRSALVGGSVAVKDGARVLALLGNTQRKSTIKGTLYFF
jgi:hypothetical protein